MEGELDPFRFEAMTLDGGTLDTGELVGQRRVAFWAWARWCPTCSREAPTVAAVVDRFAYRISFVGVAGRDDEAPMRAFVERHALTTIPHVVDRDGELWRRLGVPGQPMWVLVATDGTVRRFVGLVDEAMLSAALDELVSGAA